MDYRVTFAAQAERDLGKIVRFLAQKNPAAAERLGYALIDDALSLATLPRRGVAWLSSSDRSIDEFCIGRGF